MNEEPSTEEGRQALANLKGHLDEITKSLTFWCRVVVERSDAGGAASQLITSTDHVKTLAEWHEVFGHLDESGIEPETPLRVDTAWLRAVLDADDPKAMREQALNEQWSAAQVRKRTGKRKYRTREKLCSMAAKLVRCDGGMWTFQVPLSEQPPEGMPLDVVLEIKER